MAVRNADDRHKLEELLEVRQGVKQLLQIARSDKARPDLLIASIARHEAAAADHLRKAAIERDRLDHVDAHIAAYEVRLVELAMRIKELQFAKEIERLQALQAQLR